MSDVPWQPSAARPMLVARQALYQKVRDFFYRNGVLEVETPLLSRAGVTEPQIQSASTLLQGPGMAEPTRFYLQTSPEYAMKRLLAADSGPIFQICKVVRDDEIGPQHNPEFSLLEWYRPDWDDRRLMSEVESLLHTVLGTQQAAYLSYSEAFEQFLGIHLFQSQTYRQLVERLSQEPGLVDLVSHETDLDTLLQLALSQLIEPRLGESKPCFLYDFPASQAALARLDPERPELARRFEVYFKGFELANGFWELTDAVSQRERFMADNVRRRTMQLPEQPLDEALLAALSAGMPPAAGVALGLDRLLMLQTGARHIADVLAFPIERA